MKLRLPLSLVFVSLLLLAGCRAGGPSGVARTVAAFFKKYEASPGFHGTEWSAGIFERLALVKAAKLLGGNDLTNGITAIREAHVISFVPTTPKMALQSTKLVEEARGVLLNERYDSFATVGTGSARYALSTRGSGDEISEIAAIGSVANVAGSFVMVSIQGKFTRSEVTALGNVLPKMVETTAVK